MSGWMIYRSISYICPEMNKVIHHCTVIYMSLIILIRMMAMPISLMEYALNKDFITSSLCENRFRPEVHCGGTCYLNKQLTRANDNQDTQNHQGTVKILIIDFFESITQPQFGCRALTDVHPIASNTKRTGEIYHDHLFRPPII
jgi:hypothetical protein